MYIKPEELPLEQLQALHTEVETAVLVRDSVIDHGPSIVFSVQRQLKVSIRRLASLVGCSNTLLVQILSRETRMSLDLAKRLLDLMENPQ